MTHCMCKTELRRNNNFIPLETLLPDKKVACSWYEETENVCQSKFLNLLQIYPYHEPIFQKTVLILYSANNLYC